MPEPERLTELYFTHPNSLPSSYTPDQFQAIDFTTHNLEYRTTDYSYLIIESDVSSNKTQTLGGGDFTLAQNGYKKSSVSIPIVDLGQHVKVEVELVNQNESIDYLLTRSGS